MAEKNVENSHYENPYMKKPKAKKTIWQQIYNKEKNRILGRTPQSIAKLIGFYCIFYTGLIILFLICMKGLLSTLNENEPKYKLDSSLIGNNPGVSFKPTPTYDSKLGMVIKYNASDPSDVQKWINAIDNFVKPYDEPNKQSCEKDNEELCSFNPSNWGDCAPGTGYGYNTSSPCIFVKLNKIYEWVPEFYLPNALPNEIPSIIKEHIDMLPENEKKQIWVSCDKIGSNDTVEVVYHGFGFPERFYPFISGQSYLSPLVPIQFQNVTGLVTIECRVWAKNIKYNSHKDNRQGSIRFKLDVAI